MLAKVATMIAGGQSSVAIVINGGEITLIDAEQNTAEEREL